MAPEEREAFHHGDTESTENGPEGNGLLSRWAESVWTASARAVPFILALPSLSVFSVSPWFHCRHCTTKALWASALVKGARAVMV